MARWRVVAIVIVFAGCSSSSPTFPEPRPGVYVRYGIVVDESGICIKDATVTIVGGQRNGEFVTQRTPCSAFDAENESSGGFVITGLSVGDVLTLRGSAPGYDSRDVTVRILGLPVGLVEIRLPKSGG